MLKRVHHINFVVRDLAEATGKFESLAGEIEWLHERLDGRRVDTARFRLGDTWIVLVCPDDSDSMPGRYLADKGEGLFLISLEVDDLAAAVSAIARRGDLVLNEEPRRGLADWQVVDLKPEALWNTCFQLAHSSER